MRHEIQFPPPPPTGLKIDHFLPLGAMGFCMRLLDLERFERQRTAPSGIKIFIAFAGFFEGVAGSRRVKSRILSAKTGPALQGRFPKRWRKKFDITAYGPGKIMDGNVIPLTMEGLEPRICESNPSFWPGGLVSRF